jgi:murein DD-endopeptidase MepM/ murein hydrolase activator NlpD
VSTSQPVLPDEPHATIAPDPLRFVFPTPGPAPVSAWRPPLYPTPWAPTAYDHFYFARPIAADEVNWPVADYRYGGEFFEDVIHTGVDIPAAPGTPVLATGSGEVIWAGYGVYRGGYDETDPYGLAVLIRHDFGYQGQPLYTIYGHLDQIDVAEGQYVTTGQPIGLVGETGRVTGPHLHFEVRVGENSFYDTRNPELWLVPPIGWGVLAGRVLDSSGQPVDAQLIIVHSNLNGQNWFARSYGIGAVNSDPYYRENVVVGDLPAGRYELRIAYGGYSFTKEVDILPGVVTYFVFDGFDGFIQATPRPPEADFTPQPWGTLTPEP